MRRIIIDTDTATDDAVALLLALRAARWLPSDDQRSAAAATLSAAGPHHRKSPHYPCRSRCCDLERLLLSLALVPIEKRRE